MANAPELLGLAKRAIEGQILDGDWFIGVRLSQSKMPELVPEIFGGLLRNTAAFPLDELQCKLCVAHDADNPGEAVTEIFNEKVLSEFNKRWKALCKARWPNVSRCDDNWRRSYWEKHLGGMLVSS